MKRPPGPQGRPTPDNRHYAASTPSGFSLICVHSASVAPDKKGCLAGSVGTLPMTVFSWCPPCIPYDAGQRIAHQLIPVASISVMADSHVLTRLIAKSD